MISLQVIRWNRVISFIFAKPLPPADVCFLKEKIEWFACCWHGRYLLWISNPDVHRCHACRLHKLADEPNPSNTLEGNISNAATMSRVSGPRGSDIYRHHRFIRLSTDLLPCFSMVRETLYIPRMEKLPPSSRNGSSFQCTWHMVVMSVCPGRLGVLSCRPWYRVVVKPRQPKDTAKQRKLLLVRYGASLQVAVFSSWKCVGATVYVLMACDFTDTSCSSILLSCLSVLSLPTQSSVDRIMRCPGCFSSNWNKEHQHGVHLQPLSSFLARGRVASMLGQVHHSGCILGLTYIGTAAYRKWVHILENPARKIRSKVTSLFCSCTDSFHFAVAVARTFQKR